VEFLERSKKQVTDAMGILKEINEILQL